MTDNTVVIIQEGQTRANLEFSYQGQPLSGSITDRNGHRVALNDREIQQIFQTYSQHVEPAEPDEMGSRDLPVIHVYGNSLSLNDGDWVKPSEGASPLENVLAQHGHAHR
jgi:hypothetical protein